MRYTPLSRFQGTMLGAALGTILGANCRDRPGSTPPKFWSDVTDWGFQPLASQPGLEGAVPWGTMAVEQMRRFIHRPPRGAEPSLQDAVNGSVVLHNQEFEGGWAIATLPFALLYHEDLNLLRQQIQLTVAQAHSPAAEIGAIVVNSAIALALQNRLQPSRLLPQLIADLQLSYLQPALAEQLTDVQTRLGGQTAEDLTAETVIPLDFASLSPIALAFYAFLSTAENFRLSLLRAAQLSSSSAYISTLTITGALSGAYNGKAVLPIDWRKALHSVPENRSPLSLLWDVNSEAELLQYAQTLLAVWSGMYNSTQDFLSSRSPTVVTSPRTIRGSDD
jgi:ADP-ribosylglycohydrolase